MNEQRFAHRVRQALDESADRLPYRVTQRLERARHAALARALPAQQPSAATAASAFDAALTLGGPRPSVTLRLLTTLAPILLVAAGLYGISIWEDAQLSADTADIDTALLLADDGVPIAAYADRGFGVYIKNVTQ